MELENEDLKELEIVILKYGFVHVSSIQYDYDILHKYKLNNFLITIFEECDGYGYIYIDNIEDDDDANYANNANYAEDTCTYNNRKYMKCIKFSATMEYDLDLFLNNLCNQSNK